MQVNFFYFLDTCTISCTSKKCCQAKFLVFFNSDDLFIFRYIFKEFLYLCPKWNGWTATVCKSSKIFFSFFTYLYKIRTNCLVWPIIFFFAANRRRPSILKCGFTRSNCFLTNALSGSQGALRFGNSFFFQKPSFCVRQNQKNLSRIQISHYIKFSRLL
jgi:hypothetical protein